MKIELREGEPENRVNERNSKWLKGEFDVFDESVTKSKRLRDADMWYFSKGFTPDWTWVRGSELIDLHQSHYEQTSEYKSMVRFFDVIAPLKERLT